MAANGRSRTSPRRLVQYALSLTPLLSSSGYAQQAMSGTPQTIDFEDTAGPQLFGTADPPLNIQAATFSGGQILSDATFLPVDSTTVYGTADFCSGCLPTITINFSQKVSNFNALLLNGEPFTVTYTTQDDQGTTQTITLPANFELGAGTISIPDSNIVQVTIAGDPGGWDFLIDNVSYNASSVTILDPVASGFLNGNMITTDTDQLATGGSVVQGVAADGAAEVLVRIPASSVGQTFQVTVGSGSSPKTDGGLFSLGDDPNSATSSLNVSAVSTSAGPMAFVLYKAPSDFSRGSQDNEASSRQVSLQVQSGASSAIRPFVTQTTNIIIVRSPVFLVHGLWADYTAWDTLDLNQSLFNIKRANYGLPIQNIKLSNPQYKPDVLAGVLGNALGFAYNAPIVLSQLRSAIASFGKTQSVAVVRADVVAHSMGGVVSRAMTLTPKFLSDTPYNVAPIHKLITIGTPHLGTPFAIDGLRSVNSCTRGILASNQSVSLVTVQFSSGQIVSGAVGDLQGDGFGGKLSLALTALPNQPQEPFPSAYVAGITTYRNVASLSSNISAKIIRTFCDTSPLARRLTPSKWVSEYGQQNDAIVPLKSELNGTSGPTLSGVIHSIGSEGLGFTDPIELSPTGSLAQVSVLLDESIDGPDFHPGTQ